MILFHRRGLVAPSRLLDAVQFAAEISARVNEVLPDAQVRTGSGIGGPQSTVHWFSQYDDMAALERSMDRLMADEQYRLLLSRAGELFLPGHTRDEIVRTF